MQDYASLYLTYNYQAVPEPSHTWLLGCAAVPLIVVVRKKLLRAG
jgi:hypothetical protein